MSEKNRKKSKKIRKWIIITIVFVLLAIITAAFILRPKNANYEVVNAKRGNITTYYSFSGNVETKNRQTVISEKIMQISEINVKEGERVKEGTVLIKTTMGDEIKSKIAGEIVNIDVEESQQLMAGTKLLEIVDYNNLQINVKVDEYDISALEKGKETLVKVGAVDKEIKGKITSMSKEGQVLNGVTFFTATIDLEKDEKIKIGMSAEVKLVSKKAENVITLPVKAIQFDSDNKPYVLKRDEKDSVVKHEITVGINDGMTAEIKSGVKDLEEILYKDTTQNDNVFGPPRMRNSNSDRGED